MILELCVTELEDVATDISNRRNMPLPVVQETPHPYPDNATLSNAVVIPGKILLFIYFFYFKIYVSGSSFLNNQGVTSL